MPFPIPTGPLARALAARSYSDPTPVQAAVLEPTADGRDLIVSAQTGSGKTVAYGLAIGDTLLGGAETLGRAGEPLGLVIAPTRELALQVHRELSWLYGEAGARIVTCVGGMDPRAEMRQLNDGAHIVVGTPGRLRDHLERGRLMLGGLKALVLDEADEMLNLGFREDLEFILDATSTERRTLLFSATLPKPIIAMAKRYQKDALRLEIAGDTDGHADIEYRAVRIAPNEAELAVVNVLRYFEAPSAIVFCNTREAVRHLAAVLLERGFSSVTLSGELGQNERNRTMQLLRDGQARVCVATDVAARGIDIPNLGLVVHADLPHDAETLQHRSGRTGRAGRKGVSVLLVSLSRRRKAEHLFAQAGVQPIWGGAPSPDEIRKRDEERLLADPLLTAPSGEDDRSMAEALLKQHSPEEIAAALARFHRARLPAPEDVFDPGPPRDHDRGPRDYADGRGRKPREREEHVRGGPTVWFRLDVGRKNNADPKWILPLLCRRGNISRGEIGAIRIFDNETKFEIAEASAKRFLQSAARDDEEDIAISELGAGGKPAAGERPARGAPFKRGKPKKPGGFKDKKRAR
ncbi:DEAD/DEAH box helicase [Aurantimonas sp. MSK8Z-1]|uniref:DEAD/DEAH box helicase n=1 Tax=Mangrovibrevibacter kandeliae TaxID=2968473 RepID=UPI0021179A69|nr:DEAD/DEAH box helicase [Aurantimonas sp. MSK8Z-1]MCW4116186.1 DEAD/DEAH box helicase [Aurantimonas sp. MSK8Z-1]